VRRISQHLLATGPQPVCGVESPSPLCLHLPPAAQHHTAPGQSIPWWAGTAHHGIWLRSG